MSVILGIAKDGRPLRTLALTHGGPTTLRLAFDGRYMGDITLPPISLPAAKPKRVRIFTMEGADRRFCFCVDEPCRMPCQCNGTTS